MDTLELNKMYRSSYSTIIITKKTRHFITYNKGSLFSIPQSDKYAHSWTSNNIKQKLFVSDNEIYVANGYVKEYFKSPFKLCYIPFDESRIIQHIEDL